MELKFVMSLILLLPQVIGNRRSEEYCESGGSRAFQTYMESRTAENHRALTEAEKRISLLDCLVFRCKKFGEPCNRNCCNERLNCGDCRIMSDNWSGCTCRATLFGR
uniref:Conotoxin n=1 Tax=Conus betulinus TaxID=89764 RepID=A0A1P7ZCR7_CONBE|nr:Conotoxin [Conus betulinus]